MLLGKNVIRSSRARSACSRIASVAGSDLVRNGSGSAFHSGEEGIGLPLPIHASCFRSGIRVDDLTVYDVRNEARIPESVFGEAGADELLLVAVLRQQKLHQNQAGKRDSHAGFMAVFCLGVMFGQIFSCLMRTLFRSASLSCIFLLLGNQLVQSGGWEIATKNVFQFVGARFQPFVGHCFRIRVLMR